MASFPSLHVDIGGGLYVREQQCHRSKTQAPSYARSELLSCAGDEVFETTQPRGVFYVFADKVCWLQTLLVLCPYAGAHRSM